MIFFLKELKLLCKPAGERVNAITDISLSISYSQASITYKFVGYYLAWVALLW